MKWLTVFIAAFAAVFSLFSLQASAQTAKVEIQSVSHAVLPEGKENITFKLSGPVAPKIFTMDGGNPRLVVDFPGTSYTGKSIPIPGGALATAIRIGLHQKPEQKVRVVVDLAKGAAVQHSLGAYAEADRTLTVTLAATSAIQPQNTREEQKDAAVDRQPTAETPPVAAQPAAKPPEQQPAPPVLPPKEVKADQPVAEKPDAEKPVAERAQLLDITFDGNSPKGEMVLFHLNDFHPPTVSAVEKDNPQVVCDFAATSVSKKVQDNIAAKGKYVQRIRTIKQKKSDTVQVILDLSPHRDYDLQQVFFKNDNLFVLIVNELGPEKEAASENPKDGKNQ